jgi:hypothetical protein
LTSSSNGGGLSGFTGEIKKIYNNFIFFILRTLLNNVFIPGKRYNFFPVLTKREMHCPDSLEGSKYKEKRNKKKGSNRPTI